MADLPEISNEMLMAFVDGELKGAELRIVLDYLDRNPGDRARLTPYQATRADLPPILSEALIGPSPDRLLETIMTAPGPASGATGRAPPSRRTETLWDTLAASFGGLFSRTSLGLPVTALALGAVAGILVGTRLPSFETPGSTLVAMRDGAIVAAGPLASALESATGDKPATLSAGDGAATWTPVLTFEAEDGRFCRQYTLSIPAGSQSAGLACRAAAGQWQIESAVALGQAAGQGGVRPSGRQGEIEDKVARMIKGDAIVGAPERSLIDRHWAK